MGLLDAVRETLKKRKSTLADKEYKCPNCGTKVKLDMERCPQCGIRIKSMFRKKCPKCGEMCELDAKVCPKCGYNFEAEINLAKKTVWRCPRCGYEMETLYTQCPSCGIRLM